MKVYLSFKIRDNSQHREQATYWTAQLQLFGHDVVNPLDVPPACEMKGNPRYAACTTPGKLMPTGHTWQCYLRADLATLMACDAIAMVPGWETSKGAMLEIKTAVAVGIEVILL